MEVNKLTLRLALMEAVVFGIKRHFKAARFINDDEQPDENVRLVVTVFGLKFEITIKEAV